MSDTDSLVSGLPVLQRLALSYAPASASLPTLALLALDVRLAGIVRAASEPMLAQLRLAWWRELLAAHLSARPTGEPLLEILPSWEGDFDTLAGLVNGWEEMTGAVPLASSALEWRCGSAPSGIMPPQSVLAEAGPLPTSPRISAIPRNGNARRRWPKRRTGARRASRATCVHSRSCMDWLHARQNVERGWTGCRRPLCLRPCGLEPWGADAVIRLFSSGEGEL